MKFLKIEKKERVAYLGLNRVDSLNALSRDFLQEIIETTNSLRDQAIKSEIRAMVLHSHSEKAFCVGADLKERKGMNREETIATLDLLRACMDGIACFPMPTIAVVEGFALGGGLELALSCDMRIFSPNAKVGLSEASLGIIPGAGGTQRLSRLIGVARAKEVIFKAERISGESAMELGICNACDGEAYNLAEKWANQIANNAPLSLRYSKEAIDMGSHLELSQGLDCERQSYLSVLDSEDRIEGLKAFAEKRNPNYQGK